MAKKNEGLTPRQRQSQRIMRAKAVRKKRQAIMRTVQIYGGGFLAASLICGGLWGWKSGAFARADQAVSDKIYAVTAQAGFTVRTIYLEGRGRTSLEEINQALGTTKGEPIFKLSLSDMRDRLEHIESVRVAAVERELPGTLHVRIAEREPVALWQYQGKIAPVDDNGSVMTDIDSKPYRHLPLIVGEDAPQHVGELMDLLAAEPNLTQRFASAIRVGDRRWNIRFDNGVEIKLPENDPMEAWKKLAKLETSQKLLDRDVKVIDLRLPDRLFLTVPPAPQEPQTKNKNAKET